MFAMSVIYHQQRQTLQGMRLPRLALKNTVISYSYIIHL